MESQSYPAAAYRAPTVTPDHFPKTTAAFTRSGATTLTARQQRELDYHRQYAKRNQKLLSAPFSFEVLEKPRRRWWNAYWQMYVQLLALDVRDRDVLVVGCGFGEDALRLAKLGARVTAFDLCPDSIELAKQLAKRHKLQIDFAVMPAECLGYADSSFDCIVARDILHHVDVATTMRELSRVAKPQGVLVINEIYSHSITDRIRHWPAVARILYPKMQSLIYGPGDPYITEDERKLNERDLDEIKQHLRRPLAEKYFNFLVTRIIPEKFTFLAKMDRLFLGAGTLLGRLLAGRILLTAHLSKAAVH
jgi:ubiquinone/menaquinone biosynthesis C-methylase UbiE